MTMPSHEQKGRASSGPNVAQIQQEMEARRLHMLKMLEESKAKLKSILDAAPPQSSETTKSASKHDH